MNDNERGSGLLDAILAQAKPEGEPVELSGWEPGATVTVRLRRPALHQLLAADAALNPLIPELNKLFIGHDYKKAAEQDGEYARAMREIAKAALVEPSWDQLEAAGVTLLDDQLLEIAMYATEGAGFLRTFREKIRGGAGKPRDPVPNAAQPAAAP